MAGGKVAVFGVPSAAGRPRAGGEPGPVAPPRGGPARSPAGHRAPRWSTSPTCRSSPIVDDPAHPQARNAAVVACAVRAAADEMTRALAEGFTVLLGGDCSLVAGTVAGARRHLGQPVGLVFLDADADLNTPDTTPSGFLHGMALATALGRGPKEVVEAMGPPPFLDPEHVSLVGFRALDPGERAPLGEPGPGPARPAARRVGHEGHRRPRPGRGRQRRRADRGPPRRGRHRPGGDAGPRLPHARARGCPSPRPRTSSPASWPRRAWSPSRCASTTRTTTTRASPRAVASSSS